MSRCRQCK
ncbi:hypothetical protein D049_2865A, partial [Vibrio parahaemolyticus VPTS-2010]